MPDCSRDPEVEHGAAPEAGDHGVVELPQHDRVREQPADVEDAEERPRDARERILDLRLAELAHHHHQQRRRHQQRGVVLVADVGDDRQRRSRHQAIGDERLRALVLDQAVELALPEQHDHDDRHEIGKPAEQDQVDDGRNQHRRGQQPPREIAVLPGSFGAAGVGGWGWIAAGASASRGRGSAARRSCPALRARRSPPSRARLAPPPRSPSARCAAASRPCRCGRSRPRRARSHRGPPPLPTPRARRARSRAARCGRRARS